MEKNTIYEHERIKLLNIILKKIKEIEESIQNKINQSINNLINGAPESLDTLKELADAIVSINTNTPKETSIPNDGFYPNIFYSIGEIQNNTEFVLIEGEDENILNEYLIEFSIGNVVPQIVWPNGLSWLNEQAPELNANKTYQLSIVDNLAILAEF